MRSTEAGSSKTRECVEQFLLFFSRRFKNSDQKILLQKNSKSLIKFIQKISIHQAQTEEMNNVCVYSTSLMISVDDEFSTNYNVFEALILFGACDRKKMGRIINCEQKKLVGSLVKKI